MSSHVPSCKISPEENYRGFLCGEGGGGGTGGELASFQDTDPVVRSIIFLDMTYLFLLWPVSPSDFNALSPAP